MAIGDKRIQLCCTCRAATARKPLIKAAQVARLVDVLSSRSEFVERTELVRVFNATEVLDPAAVPILMVTLVCTIWRWEQTTLVDKCGVPDTVLLGTCLFEDSRNLVGGLFKALSMKTVKRKHLFPHHLRQKFMASIE